MHVELNLQLTWSINGDSRRRKDETVGWLEIISDRNEKANIDKAQKEDNELLSITVASIITLKIKLVNYENNNANQEYLVADQKEARLEPCRFFIHIS